MIIHHQQSYRLSTQDPLSDSTKSTISTKESRPRSKKRNKVSFHHNVLVYEDDSFSQDDRDQMHYTREEMKSFARGIMRYLQSVRRLERRSKQTYSSPLMATGLEGFLRPEHRRRHRLQGVLSVLMEQKRQYRELGHLTPTDFDSMSHFYHAACQESQQEAYQRALACHSSSYGDSQ
mmetsp:Transcript_38817/g.93831  ORF Transcript_38817/g.93831 Transcript_38817/m.93831 type:complete len:177 (+) Transcript_38817:50-580(+)